MDRRMDIETAYNQLKCCPFCGQKEALNIITRLGKDGWRDRYCVQCSYDHGGCGAESGHYHSIKEALDAWNKRGETSDPPKFTPEQVMVMMVYAGHHDTNIPIGETIKYSPSQVQKILEKGWDNIVY